MTRHSLEKNQVLFYLTAILGGLVMGAAVPESGAILEAMLWPALGLLLYATFTQAEAPAAIPTVKAIRADPLREKRIRRLDDVACGGP